MPCRRVSEWRGRTEPLVDTETWVNTMSTPFDPIVETAFALKGRPGAYAALLGSGISTGAGIPTGWQIVLDLIGQVASLTDGAVPADPLAWYVDQFGVAPTYSDLLARLGRTAAEREAIIRSFIEPPDGDAGRRPTAAHRALARLAKGGFIRVFLTTNFDRLLEEALGEVGVVPAVWATPEAVDGGLPLAHSGVVLVKLHGDYLDPGIKNTPDELDSYEPAVDHLLDEVFSNFGLLVSGWSTEHDTALRRALERSRTYRFTCWWTARSDLNGTAQRLAGHCGAEVVPVESADGYFARLADACEALHGLNRQPPATVAVAVASAKLELSGQHRAISLHDQLRDEMQRVAELPLYLPSGDYPAEEHGSRLEGVAAEIELAVALVAVSAYWGTSETDQWWMDDIERLGRYVRGSGAMFAFGLPRVPGLGILWSGGVGAVAARRYDTVGKLLSQPKSVPTYSSTLTVMPAAVSLTPEILHIGQDAQWVFRLLRRAFVQHLGIGTETYVAAWEKWQLILRTAASDLRLTDNVSTGNFSPYLRVDCPFPLDSYSLPAAEALHSDVMRIGEHHPLLSEGLFGGDPERFQAALEHATGEVLNLARSLDQGLMANTPGGFSGVPSGLHYPGMRDGHPDARSLPEP